MVDTGRPDRSESLSRQERDAVRKHLRTILSSKAFSRSVRSRDFLTHIVGNAIRGDYGNLRERMIGATLFGRPLDYDTGSDSVVRVIATEVRKRLNQFYLESRQNDWPVRFDIPSGSYVPLFVFSASGDQVAAQSGDPIEPSPADPTVDVTPLSAENAPPEKPKEEEAIQEVQAARSRFWWSKWNLTWQITFLLIAALVSFGVYKLAMKVVHRSQPIRSLVILPLKNLSGDPNEDYFADGVTAELINTLGRISTLRVISLTTSMSLKGSQKKIPDIARELNVQGVIEGDVQREGNRIRINIELVDGRKDYPIWTQTYTRDVGTTLALEGEVAEDIVSELTIPVSSKDRRRLTRTNPVSPAAHIAYLRGLVLLEAVRDRSACTALQEAVREDPQFAQAHSALAECLGRMAVSGLKPNLETFSSQKSEALQAIALDPSLAEAHAELADAVMALDWDWKTAGKEYQRALELNPNSAEIHQKYAIFLIFQGNAEEAIKEVKTGVDLDPVSTVAIRNEVFVYFFARKYSEVLSLISTARSSGIEPPAGNFFLGASYAQMKQYKAAIEWLLNAPESPHTLGHLGSVYALSGQRAAAEKSLDALQADVRNQGIGQYELALVYAGLGDKKNAIQWLKRACDVHDVGLLYIKVDPFLDPLRGEPEFRYLVKRVGLTL